MPSVPTWKRSRTPPRWKMSAARWRNIPPGSADFQFELLPDGPDFDRLVWKALSDIPFGTTTSYGAIAKTIGHPTAARAVGAANGANPIALIVPCHRVIGSDGSLTGFGGGLPLKRKLLEHEARVCGTRYDLFGIDPPPSQLGLACRQHLAGHLPLPVLRTEGEGT